MTKKLLLLLSALILSSSLTFAQRLQQRLGRGVVVVKRNGTSRTGDGGSGALVSWRKLAEEPESTTYNLYKRSAGSGDYTKVNAQPLTKTNYTLATSALTTNTEWAVTAIINGMEGEKSLPFLYKTRTWDNVWFDFDFDDTVIKRNDYRTKFVWPMDLDGNGEFDAVVVDRLYAGAVSGEDDAENSTDNTATTSHKIQAYKLDGTLLWTVDMGPNVNICSGQNDMVLAYDINCDGRCEVIIRSSDGTRFWNKARETWGTYVGGSDTGDIDGDGIIDYRTQTKRNPPFYISVIDGATGAELAYNELKYSELSEGGSGDSYGRDNRSNYMNFGYGAMEGHYGIAYLDGIHPSLIMECEDRDTGKLHHGYVLTWDFDWNSGQPSNWHHSHTWVRNPKRPGCAEFHQIRILDSDGDGCDEMWAGGYGVNPAQNRFTSTGLAHGDRFVISDIDSERPGLEGFAIQQSALLGQCLYDARTAERIKEWYLPSVYDVGRGTAMDVDPAHKGFEIYSYADEYYYTCKGEATSNTRSGSIYEGVWWNGDLQREELNSPGGSGWGTNMMVTSVLNKARLIEFSREANWGAMGATGTRPAFMGDIMGDWREEVILAKQNDSGSTGLVGYTTAIPTNYSIYCLQQDPHYRLDCTTRGYYQHPNTGFYLGGDMPMPPLPPVLEADMRYQSGVWSNGAAGFTSFDQTRDVAYADGKSVMFDISGASTTVDMTGEVKPSATYFMNPVGKDYVLNGTIGGDGLIFKSQQGMVTINGDLKTTGKTMVSEGTLTLNGSMDGDLELRARGTLAGNAVLNGETTFEGGLNYEGCRLAPGTKEAPFGILTFNKSLTLSGDVFLEMDLQTKDVVKCDLLKVNGDLTFLHTNTFTIVPTEEVPAEGEYVLAECTGVLTVDVAQLKVRGLVGLNYEVEVKEKQVVLHVRGMRAPAMGVTWTGAESGIWDYQTNNFTLNGEAVAFVANDEVLFNDEAIQRTVTLSDKMVTKGVRLAHNSGTYTFKGEGGFSGEGDFVMNGDGTVVLNVTRSDYTGKTILNKGTVTVTNLENKGVASCFGAGSAIELSKGTLTINSTNAASDRNITLTDTATLNIPNGSTTLKSALTGKGVLVKKGSGQLNLTYGGTNGYEGTMLYGGTLSQGAWNATLGKSGSKIEVMGNAAISIFNNNSTSAVPSLNNAITVQKGKVLTLNTGQRCKVQGKLLGEGTVKISFPYVRGDFEANCSAFEGVLNPTSGQFRISNTLDLSKGTFQPEAGVYVANVKSQSGTEEGRTNKIGALQGTAADASFGTGTWNVGYLGTNTTFAGKFNASATLNKYGDGVLTLTGASEGAINIYGGEIQAQNTSASVTMGTITVRGGGRLAGTGQVQNVTVQKDGMLGAGKSATAVGTLIVNGNLTMNAGSILRVRTRSTATRTTADAFKVAGKVKLTSPMLVMEELNDANNYVDNAEIKVFTGDGSITITGDITMQPATPKEGWLWDTSTLATDGTIRVVPDPTGIRTLSASTLTDSDVVCDMTGRRLGNISQSGFYIVNGKKVYIER